MSNPVKICASSFFLLPVDVRYYRVSVYKLTDLGVKISIIREWPKFLLEFLMYGLSSVKFCLENVLHFLVCDDILSHIYTYLWF